MTEKSRLQTKNVTPRPSISLSRSGLLQRTCACGGVPGLTGECEGCASQRLSGQQGNPPALPNRPSEDRSTAPMQGATPGGYSFGNLAIEPKERFGIQTKLAIGQPGDRYEHEAEFQHDFSHIPALMPGSQMIQAKKNKGADSEEVKRVEALKAKYEAAVTEAVEKPENWSEAAVLLNGFNTSDILEMLRKLTSQQWQAMYTAAPEWVIRIREPLSKLLNFTGTLDDKQFQQIKKESLKEEKTRVKKLTEDYQTAVQNQDWSQAAVLLNGFSDQDINSLLKKLSKNQRVAMYYVTPDGATRVKDFIAKLDKIGAAAVIEDKEFEQVKQLYPDGVTIAIYANYKVGVSGAPEFKRAGEEFAKNQNAIALSGDQVVVGSATPINDLSAVTVAIQRIHLGLLAKYQQSQTQAGDAVPPPKFTKIKNLALFAHGEPYGVGLDSSNKFELQLKNVKTFVSGLRSAITEDIRIQLFACSTAADRALVKSKGKKAASYIEWTGHEQNQRKGADSFAAALATELGPESTVVGHTTVGHTTENFAARVFGKGAGGGEGGLHLFDLMYKETFIQDELKRLFPDKTDSDRADLHDSLREQMWSHYKASLQMDNPETKDKDEGKYSREHYTRPMGQEMFINPSNSEKLLHEDWQKKWIGDRLNQVKPIKPKSK